MIPPDEPIGRIEHVPLREVWVHEALAFTPWLAANLDLLAVELGLVSLDRIDEEVSVGAFSLDILAETHDNRRVIIENQIEPTDHTHLGQLLTYAAGLDAELIVWVSARVRDEHQSALNWLNENTNGNVHFFAVEVGAVRIGDSPPAPVFNVRARPNDWEATVKRAVDQSPRMESVEDWLAEVSLHRPSCMSETNTIVDHWRTIGGYFDFGSGSLFLMSPLAQPPGHGIWPCAIYSGGKVEVVFQHLAKRSVFQDESMREQLRLRVNEIPGVTQLPANSLQRRPGFDLRELRITDALDAFLDVLTWFHQVVQHQERQTESATQEGSA